MEYEYRKAQLLTVVTKLRDLRRHYNNILKDVAEGKVAEYNGEDLVRLVGTLEAAYNHALVSIASDGDIYCLLKHCAYAIILAGEMDSPDVEELYEIMTIISDGRIEPCASCKREEEEDKDKLVEIDQVKKGAQDE